MGHRYSVIIPTYNRREGLALVFRGLEAQDAPELIEEVVIVDDGSSDGTADWVRAQTLPWPVRLLEGRRGGPAAARNAGIAVAEGRYVLFLCDDIEPTPGLVRGHHECRDRGATTCCVQGRVDWPPDTVVTHFMRFALEHYHWSFEGLTDGEELDWRHFVTSNASIELATLREQGCFDEGFTYGFEDTDLGLRLERAGALLRYAESAVGHHHHVIDLASYCRREEAVGISAAHFARKHPDLPELIGADKLPRPGSPRWFAKGLARNRLNIACWRWLASAVDRAGLERMAETLYFQILSYYYYRGMAAGLRETPTRPEPSRNQEPSDAP